MKEFKGFEGHIILFCKNHYKCDAGFINGMRMIWSIWCGLEYSMNDRSMDRAIANGLFKIHNSLSKKNQDDFINEIHRVFDFPNYNKELTPLENIINFYGSEISFCQVKEKNPVTNKWVTLIKLPKPNKRLFNKILRGKGNYNDYYLIKE